MQKIVTVTANMNVIKKEDGPFVEHQYADVNRFLSEGYVVKQAIPIVKPSDQTYLYSIIFILEK